MLQKFVLNLTEDSISLDRGLTLLLWVQNYKHVFLVSMFCGFYSSNIFFIDLML